MSFNNSAESGCQCPELIDTHCHLDLEPLCAHLDGLMTDAVRAGVSHCIVPGVHPDGWERMTLLSRKYPRVHAAYGIHPMHAGLADDAVLSHLASIASAGVAIGETGLDPAYEIPLEMQEKAFREQLRLAVSLGLPVLVHCRKAFQKTLRIMQEEGARKVGGIMHAYSGSSEMAREFIRLGFAISVSGMVTRDNSLRLQRVVHALALDDLVIETDAPDLTPQRYRGLPNQPAYLTEILLAVARIKGVEPAAAASSCRARTLAVISGLRAC